MVANRDVYRAVFGHVGDILPGALFESRWDVKGARLHKAERDGISWGLDGEDQRAADAIVLSKGYEDDRDQWDEVLYTGAGGRDENTGRQVKDQTWDNFGNAGLRRSQNKGYPVRVIRGSTGEKTYSPAGGYRYDGLYQIVNSRLEQGKAGFQICRFELHRLPDNEQELTPLEEQVQDVLCGVPPRQTTTVERIVRDTAVSRRVKRWHDYTCQICGLALTVGADGASYAEGAHIQALGGQDGGPDVDGNVLCLCPNCHVRLDRGALYLTDNLRVVDRYAEGLTPRSVSLRTVAQHRIEQRFIRAHRRLWRIASS
ncbi:YDG/SRA domain-containing protein [Streptomyces sp. NPDC126933]|uniref:YDG/SRA domain-containing protein n=1 Tax=unclassified Streptomyces TaxID=2593676 RepID=UPI0036469C04